MNFVIFFVLTVTSCQLAQARWVEVPDSWSNQDELDHRRYTRQVRGSSSLNPSAGTDVNLAVPVYRGESGTGVATGFVTGAQHGGYSSAGGGLAYHTDSGHAASVTGTHIPGFGNQLTGAGKVNLLDSGDHRLDAGAFASRTFPNSETRLPNFNTYGGNLGYTYNDKIGASLSAAHTPLFQKTDVAAMGNLNLFRDHSRSLDFSAGASRSFSPYIPKSSWEPKVSLGLTQRW